MTWEHWVALASACEEHGLDGLFRSDHYLSITRGGRAGSLDAWATINALAALTERIRLGTLVSPVTFRPASVLAKNVVTADHVSNGRVELGIGAGWYEAKHEVYGFPFFTARERVALLREHIDTIVHQWTDHPEVWAQARPAAVSAADRRRGGKAGHRRTGRALGDRVQHDERRPERVPRAASRPLDDACREAGRGPETLPLSVMATCVVGSDDRDLHDRVALFLQEARDDCSVDEYLKDDSPDRLVGAIDEVAERLRAYERVGVARVMLRPPAHEDVGTIPLLGRVAAAVG